LKVEQLPIGRRCEAMKNTMTSNKNPHVQTQLQAEAKQPSTLNLEGLDPGEAMEHGEVTNAAR